MTDMITIGIDPGITGAIAILDHSGHVLVLDDLPTIASGKAGAKVQRKLDPLGLESILRKHLDPNATSCAVESVSAMPKQGVSSMFSLGDTAGTIRAVVMLLRIPLTFTAASAWKRAMALDSDKERSRARAIELYPEVADRLARKADHNRAEALLLARWLRGREH